jgi:cytochrome c-type biogenesis protein CcmH/NrfG
MNAATRSPALCSNFVTNFRPHASANDIVIRDMSWRLSKLVPRSAPVILLILTLGAIAGFGAVGHLVARYNANQQSRGRKLYAVGLADANANDYDDAIDAFRAALTCDPANSQYQLSLARALRDSGDPSHLDEAESYLVALWQRTPQDAAVNLALARVAAHRGSIDDAIRYYHNAMYGVWNSDADANRSSVRIELIQYLLKKNARAQADSELIALATNLPRNATAHLQAAQLFMQTQDYAGALAQYQEVLRLEPNNAAAPAGIGTAAYRMGNYMLAQRYLRNAVSANAADNESRQLLATTDLVLRSNPFHSYISDAERDRRIAADFDQAQKRLAACAEQTGVNLSAAGSASSSASASSAPPSSPLLGLQARWTAVKPDLRKLRSSTETDLPDTIMDVTFQIEQQTAATCGQPQGLDLALLLISEQREAPAQ